MTRDFRLCSSRCLSCYCQTEIPYVDCASRAQPVFHEEINLLSGTLAQVLHMRLLGDFNRICCLRSSPDKCHYCTQCSSQLQWCLHICFLSDCLQSLTMRYHFSCAFSFCAPDSAVSLCWVIDQLSGSALVSTLFQEPSQ